ncbi:Putative DNA polymerase III subunits gamma and tau [Candidatus Phycorickettsia trachydisci]|uniref:DNA polymerase III subunit gamma/tau n=1 Tax=Candidatus Phycorickettsia trachydisci TaxID=2115978 RepID=A0A2P1P6W6_9RICK|nr:DNA polymerase III subunit gamma/tau [Candidatus Phycorickettsia trachydisci]AVP87014.1 Putative DNA polymerase III subunits gamma and tau [Candidatus Phycorickettsia trachydisci]
MRKSYLPLARKYRPTIFPDIIGQEVFTKVLSYCIQEEKLAHSFLFTGIRGIGKTTSARIVAQTINCSETRLQDGVIVSCRKCTNCISIQNQSHPDVIELDAASYTSVDNIRDIIEKSVYLPVMGKYKVFIIDEAHMLSKSAFNALLKILEEPPAQVVFMLLTTEPNKIPLTVASRCQKFNLRRLGLNDLVKLLDKVCKSENIVYEKGALELIAYKADGSARDGLVLLEQSWNLASRNHGKITNKLLEDILDLSYTSYAINFIDFIIKKDITAALDLAKNLYDRNFDFASLLDAIIDTLTCLTKISFVPNYDIGFYKHYEADLKKLLDGSDIGYLTALWQIFNKGLPDLASGKSSLMYFEMLLIKAMYSRSMPRPTNTAKTETTPKQEKPKVVVEQKPLELKQEVQEDQLVEEDFVDFIRYTCAKTLFDLYHFLMNECEAVEFSRSAAKFAAVNISAEIKNKLTKALGSWEKDLKVTFINKVKITSFNEKLKTDLKKDKQFQFVQSIFPEVEIKEIVLDKVSK